MSLASASALALVSALSLASASALALVSALSLASASALALTSALSLASASALALTSESNSDCNLAPFLNFGGSNVVSSSSKIGRSVIRFATVDNDLKPLVLDIAFHLINTSWIASNAIARYRTGKTTLIAIAYTMSCRVRYLF